MWDLIVSVPDHCLYFYYSHFVKGRDVRPAAALKIYITL